MINITAHKSQLRTIKQNDPGFIIQDGYTLASRAGFEISEKCPREYRMIIKTALSNGWLRPVATVTEKELLFMGLSK